MKKMLLASLLLMLAACSVTKSQTVSLKAGQQYTFRNLPTTAKVKLSSTSPINFRLGNCHADQITEIEISCRPSGNPLLLVDSRNPLNIFGDYNRVIVTVEASPLD